MILTENEIERKAAKAAAAAKDIAQKTGKQKNEALRSIAEHLVKAEEELLLENAKDLEAGNAKGMSASVLDRISLADGRIEAIAEALIQLTELEDPIGEILEEWERPNGLQLKKIRVPLGVVGMIYEARPNVTVDAASLCLKTGNAVVLRGSSSSFHSNKALVAVIRQALAAADFPEEAVQLIEDTSHEAAGHMFKMNRYLDVLIPRGSAKLIQTVLANATVPVIETGAGNCHLYIDETADLEMALSIAINAKTQRPSVCNACETILVHEQWAAKHLNELVTALQEKEVVIHGDETVYACGESIVPAEAADWATEYLDLAVAVKVVASVNEAVDHINEFSTKHSEAIISEDAQSVSQFMSGVDASALYHNASTRFTDGFEFGFGAEIGISTQKLHARGPMGLHALTSSKYLIQGQGQVK
ncbi:glutamate-5-semialdehyde dehydrogenase [Planomicrobium sp. YIM 101495]|uniref:glutamate-5-semialdehyde dehydrogenase n=1 Tax=Planomicrobium sp. YIM 101495 TaxID=2665160 RepID=UPI0018AADC6D|nr:glutamate-5-semialdehyde dehydrogenase [Planomicrobium sp. YIM 101495]